MLRPGKQAPPGAQVAVPVGDLDGANVFLASYMALNAGANVRRVPQNALLTM